MTDNVDKKLDTNMPPLISDLKNLSDDIGSSELSDKIKEFDNSTHNLLASLLAEIHLLASFEELNTYSTLIYSNIPESNTKSLLLQQINVSMYNLSGERDHSAAELAKIRKLVERIMEHGSISDYKNES